MVAAPLGRPELDDKGWQALRPGGTLIDLAWSRRHGLGELLRPWAARRRLCDATAARVVHWLERGAFAPEQFIAVAPAGVVVTVVQRAVALAPVDGTGAPG